MKQVKRFICALIVCLVIIPSLPFSVSAQDWSITEYKTSADGLWNYCLIKDANEHLDAYISYYYGSDETLTIPSEIEGYTVKGLLQYGYSGLFYNNSNASNIKKIIISEGVEFIGKRCFSKMKDIEYVLPSTLKCIGESSFENNTITSINFPEGIEAIENSAFLNTTFSDTSIALPQSLRYLANLSFSKTNITSVVIGEKTDIVETFYSQTAGIVTKEKNGYTNSPFENCSSLSCIDLSENNPYFTLQNGVLLSYDVKYLIYVVRDMEELIIPDSIIGICDYALEGKTIGHLKIGAGITSLSEKMFKCAKIGKLDFSKGTTITKLNSSVFSCMPIDSLTVPASVTSISAYAFDSTGISEISFEENSKLFEIGSCAFQNAAFTELDFSNCQSLQSIGVGAFYQNKELISVDLSSTQVPIINTETFRSCSKLETVILSPVTLTIKNYAFAGDTNLRNINLDNVIELNDTAFNYCDNVVINPVVSEGVYDNYKYLEYENFVIVTGYTGNETDLIIPSIINNKPVTAVYGFFGRELDSVQLPERLEYIGNEAFMYCNLKEISDFPPTLKHIGDHAFSNDKITEVVLPDGLETIAYCAFQWCPLTSLLIPDSVVSFGNGNTNKTMNMISFGANINSIEYLLSSINNNERPKAFEISRENPYYYAEYGILYNKNKTELIKNYPYYNKSEKPSEYRIPDSVTKVHDYAFSNSSSKKITIPSSITSMGDYAFSESYLLNEVVFEDGFSAEALNGTFYHCIRLKSVTLGEGFRVKTLNHTYDSTVLVRAPIPEGVEEILGAFENVPLNGEDVITLPEGLKTIGKHAFRSTNIGGVILPQGVEIIDEEAFSHCRHLSYVELSDVGVVSKAAFAYCDSLEEIDLTGVRYIAENTSNGTFYNCKNLKKIMYKREMGLTDIGEGECRGMTSLDTIVVGNSIEEIKDKAFADCTNLETAYISDGVEKISDTAFENCEKLTIICALNSPAMFYARKNNIPYQTFKVLPLSDQYYTGYPITPKLTVSVEGRSLKQGVDYNVSYVDNVNLGTAKAIVIGLGDYSIFGAVAKFRIIKNPNEKTDMTPDTETDSEHVFVKKTRIKRLKKGKKSFTVKWKKLSGISGYQIQYSTSRKFTKKTTKTVNAGKSVKSKKIGKLSAKKKYFVRIRAYKKVGNKVFYSKWSRVKSVKTK